MLENLGSVTWPVALFLIASQASGLMPWGVLLVGIAATSTIALLRGFRVQWSNGSLEVPASTHAPKAEAERKARSTKTVR